MQSRIGFSDAAQFATSFETATPDSPPQEYHMSTVQVKSRGLGLLAAVLGGTAFVAIVLSVPAIAVLFSPGGLRGAALFLVVTAPYGLVFIVAATIVLTLLRIALPPEHDFGTVGASRYRYEVAASCAGAVALPVFVFLAAERNPWAIGSLPIGAIAGWISATVQKRHLQSESRVSSPWSVRADQ